MIRGPKGFPESIESFITYQNDGMRVLCDVYPDGKLWEASFPAETHGGIVAELIEMVPMSALDMGEGWTTEAGKTYASFWQASA